MSTKDVTLKLTDSWTQNFIAGWTQTDVQPTETSSPINTLSANTQPNWKDRAIAVLNKGDVLLNGWMPNWILQTKIDELGRYIENKFSCFGALNQWLRSNGEGAWYLKLATFLAKLPLRAAHNIINLLYTVIKGILQTAVHPLEGLNNLAKLIVSLLYALTQPETYCKIGAGMIGAGLGQALVLNIPVSLIAMIIGGALLTAGLSFGALKAAVLAEKEKKADAAVNYLWEQVVQIPESFLTGFYMGLLIGGIRKAIQQSQQKTMQLDSNHHATNLQEAQAYADKYIQQHSLPSSGYFVQFNSGTITINWYDKLDSFHVPPQPGLNLIGVKIVIPANGEIYTLVEWEPPFYGR